jgi:hypothetical protein
MKFLKDKKKVIKSYSFLSIVANILTATSISGLHVLGVISGAVALNIIIPLAVFLGVLGAVGRFIDQSGNDNEEI